eukprot:scaffold251527_cov30-Tisochrysis_lutea.AAC.1
MRLRPSSGRIRGANRGEKRRWDLSSFAVLAHRNRAPNARRTHAQTRRERRSPSTRPPHERHAPPPPTVGFTGTGRSFPGYSGSRRRRLPMDFDPSIVAFILR